MFVPVNTRSVEIDPSWPIPFLIAKQCSSSPHSTPTVRSPPSFVVKNPVSPSPSPCRPPWRTTTPIAAESTHWISVCPTILYQERADNGGHAWHGGSSMLPSPMHTGSSNSPWRPRAPSSNSALHSCTNSQHKPPLPLQRSSSPPQHIHPLLLCISSFLPSWNMTAQSAVVVHHTANAPIFNVLHVACMCACRHAMIYTVLAITPSVTVIHSLYFIHDSSRAPGERTKLGHFIGHWLSKG